MKDIRTDKQAALSVDALESVNGGDMMHYDHFTDPITKTIIMRNIIGLVYPCPECGQHVELPKDNAERLKVMRDHCSLHFPNVEI
jgi:hypothetical protein